MIVHPTYIYTIKGYNIYVSKKRINFVSIIRVNLTVCEETQTLHFFPSHFLNIRQFCNRSPPLKNYGFRVFSQKYYHSCGFILLGRQKKAVFCGNKLSITLKKPIFGGKCYFGKTQNTLESVEAYSHVFIFEKLSTIFRPPRCFRLSFIALTLHSLITLPQLNYVPVHVVPLPVYPRLQVQRYEPIVLLHCAFT